jgi:hypothetical protein
MHGLLSDLRLRTTQPTVARRYFAAARYRLCCHLAQPAAPVIGGRAPGRPDDDLDTTGSTARAPVELRGRQRSTYCADFIAIEHVSSLIEGTDLAICERLPHA